jgi:hypothetical protein
VTRHSILESALPVFPPALASVLRDRLHSAHVPLPDVTNAALVRLLTTIFFAGLESYEGEHNPVRVVFLGRSSSHFVIPGGADSGALAFYKWKVMPFESPRPFAIPELVKLAVAGANARIYSAVHTLAGGKLAITGLAREGLNADADPFVKIVASRPGCISIRSGGTLLLGYERGAILTGGEHLVFSVGPVRRALEAAASAARLDPGDVPAYLDAVQSLVREMTAHGCGGIMIISPEEFPQIASTPYRMALDSSASSLIRLAHRIERTSDAAASRRSAAADGSFGQLLRGAFLTEVGRVIEDFGALSAIDGAVLLNRELALLAFGVILPVGQPTAIAEAVDTEGLHHRRVDLGSRGTRHRAGATYAAEHPGSVVFVASEDGHLSCFLREQSWPETVFWRVGPSHTRVP